VSLKGVTGAGHLDIAAVSDRLAQLRGYSDLPLCVGFGIKDASSAKAIASVADGAVVGSVLVNACVEHASSSTEDLSDAVGHIIGEMHRAID
jgi:tryptophan synthase alpha chain